MSLRDRLREAREALWDLIGKRHDAKPGGDRRAKLAKEVREARERKDALLERIKEQTPAADGTTVIDGKQVANWIAKWVLLARSKGLWHGIVISGYRSPEYSESICRGYCGQPTCSSPPCAGRNSEHSQLVYPRGALDVDLAHAGEFASAMRVLGAPLHNAIPADPNHFSNSGH